MHLKFYTSYYGNMKEIAGDLKVVNIANYPPKGVKVDTLEEFLPDKTLLREYKAGKCGEVEYTTRYLKNLNKLDPKLILTRIEELAKGYTGVVFVCYERPDSFCHRHILASWLRSNGFEITEHPYARQKMIAVAKDTLKVMEKGYYKHGGVKIVLDPVEVPQLWCLPYKKGVCQDPGPLCSIWLQGEATVTTLFAEQGNLGVLNFGDAYSPGGGFLNGAMAQEESLAYCSNMYYGMCDSGMYDLNSGELHSIYYTDYMTVGPVMFFKDAEYNTVAIPKTVKVLTSAAVNYHEVRKHGGDEMQARRIQKARMRRVLQLFAKKGCDTLILGAFGCGVFGNDPKEIANNWIDLLYAERLGVYFKKVIFSVLDIRKEGNYKAFQGVFQDRLESIKRQA